MTEPDPAPAPVPDARITCIDCGGRAFLLTPTREDGVWLAGDIVAYRCEDCLDRWDLVLEPAEPDRADRHDVADT